MTRAPHFYSRSMRVLHWLTAALLLFAYPLAWSIEQAQSADVAARLVMLHRSVGVTVLLLTLIRLIQRFSSEVPALPSDVPFWQRWAARGNEGLLYLLMLAQPSLGLAASWLHGDHIVLFGFIGFQGVWTDRALSHQLFQIHGAVALLLLALIGLHAGAALYHLVVRRDHVMSSMVGARLLPHRTGRAATEQIP
ncbi:MAG TPA: cytochrome b/b6 domain-containing protein [Aliidongia sp.]|nr:cytochrome b/b6 domain-containing protein [Aliidongia sp.]